MDSRRHLIINHSLEYFSCDHITGLHLLLFLLFVFVLLLLLLVYCSSS